MTSTDDKIVKFKSLDALMSMIDFHKRMIGVCFMKETPGQVRDTEAFEAWNRDVGDDIVGATGTSNGIFATSLRPILSVLSKEFMSHAQFKHCEVAFHMSAEGQQRFGHNRMLAISVEMMTGVSIKPRRFHEQYVWKFLQCTEEEMKCIAYHAFMTQGAPFGAEKMNRTVTNPGPEKRDSWFCVFHAMSCLQMLPVADFHLTRCNVLTIDELYLLLDQCKYRQARSADAIAPHQLEQMYGENNVRSVWTQLQETKKGTDKKKKTVVARTQPTPTKKEK